MNFCASRPCWTAELASRRQTCVPAPPCCTHCLFNLGPPAVHPVSVHRPTSGRTQPPSRSGDESDARSVGRTEAAGSRQASSVSLLTALFQSELQALVYNILPSTVAVFSYAIGSRKLSDNEQYFVGAQTLVSLLRQLRLYQTFVL